MTRVSPKRSSAVFEEGLKRTRRPPKLPAGNTALCAALQDLGALHVEGAFADVALANARLGHPAGRPESPVSLYTAGPVLADRIGVAVLAECDS